MQRSTSGDIESERLTRYCIIYQNLKILIRAYVYIREVLHERKLPSTVISKMQFRSTVIKLLRKCGLKVKRLCWITSLFDHKNRLILKKKAVHIIGIMVRGTQPPRTESSRYSGNDCIDVSHISHNCWSHTRIHFQSQSNWQATTTVTSSSKIRHEVRK